MGTVDTVISRRERKKQQTRQAISDTATQLFLQRGFDAVTIAEIAAQADVAVQTVFNHFPAKEDLFFDDQHWVTSAAAAIRARPDDPPAEVLADDYRVGLARLLDHGYLATSPLYHRTIEASPALRGRRAELAADQGDLLVQALAERPGPPAPTWRLRLLATRYSATRLVLDAELVRLVEAVGADRAIPALGPVVDEAFAGLA